MSTTNPSPHFKGPEQKTITAVEGKLWGIQAEIKELERKFTVAGGKMHTHYQEWLEELNWVWEALQDELARRKEEGTLSTPKLSMPYPKVTLRWKEPAIPSGSGMPRMSPWVVLKDLETWLREPKPGIPSWEQEALSDTKNWPNWEETDLSSKQEQDPEELWQQKRVQKAQEKFNKNPPGQQAREEQQKWQEGPETVGPGRESEVEGIVGPRQGLSRTSTPFLQRQEYPQYQSHLETTLLLTGHSGALRNLPVPEDHQAPHSQTTLPEAHPGDWPGQNVRS